MKLEKDYEIYCFQWCSQEFFSIGQFLSQTILRIGQPWAIEKSSRLQFFKISLFQSLCWLKRKVDKLQSTDEHVRCFCTTSQRYFSTLKDLIILCVKTTTITIFFKLRDTGGYPISKSSRRKKLFATDVKIFPRRFFSSQIFWKMSCSELYFIFLKSIFSWRYVYCIRLMNRSSIEQSMQAKEAAF